MLKDEIVKLRREFHSIAESGWLEIQTTVKIIDHLKNLGYEPMFGKQIHAREFMMGMPSKEVRDEYVKSISIERDYDLKEIFEGYTGAVADLDTGKPGPCIGLRFDIDALDLSESKSPEHMPNKEGFASRNSWAFHGCGHDGHIAIGLCCAEYLMEHKSDLCGKFRIIFQPAEEGVRGAKSITEKGLCDCIDYMISGHIGLGQGKGKLGVGTGGFLATTKYDIEYRGVSAHAGLAPENGKNALLGACSCALNLHTLPQFGAGMARLNVGVLNAGSGRNVVPMHASLKVETRGENTSIDEKLGTRLREVVKACADMYGLEYSLQISGGAAAFTSTHPEFLSGLADYLEKKGYGVSKFPKLGASEDVSYMMERVENRGGYGIHLLFGTDISAPHHNECFDYDESVLENGLNSIIYTIKYILNLPDNGIIKKA